jgi:erythromycin esterase
MHWIRKKTLMPCWNRIGNARIVLLGEASHGTSEYYQWRSAISKRLIREKGFDMIAVEGEWADSYRVNQFIKGERKDSAAAVALLHHYNRWPTWMWGNYEVASLVTWLNQHNQTLAAQEKVGFFGLDVYCLWESMQELMPYIQGNDSLTRMAQQVQQCFRPYSADPMQYAYAVANESAMPYANRTAVAVCNVVYRWHYGYQRSTICDAAKCTGGPQRRTVLQGFGKQLSRFLEHPRRAHAPNHSTPAGTPWPRFKNDRMGTQYPHWRCPVYRYDGRRHGKRGQLVRESFGQENVYAVGFGSYSGSVIASNEWGGAIQTMTVPPAKKDSWEDVLHRQSPVNKIIFSNELRQTEHWLNPIGHRAIGVQYDPRREAGNYVPSVIPNRYDAFIFIDKTTALHPINIQPGNEPPDTYPSGY